MSFEAQVDDWAYPVVYGLIRLSLFAAAFFAFLFWLYQPTVSENPGVAAFQPLPGTRLEPAPRKMDAPEIVEIASTETRMVASVDDVNLNNAVIKKNLAYRQTQTTAEAFPFYRNRERVFASDRYRESNVSR